MMTDNEFEVWCQKNLIPENGKAYISRVRKSAPSRAVGSRCRNVPGFYPSAKNGFTVQFESHTHELYGIYKNEYDAMVLEYYDQPEQISIVYKMLDAKDRRYHHIPDYLVITSTGAFLDQWKPHEKLLELSVAHPDRYGLDEHGVWHFWSGEKAAEELGIKFRIRSSSEINTTLFRNLQFLEDYLREETPEILYESANFIIQAVESSPGITILALRARLSGKVSEDDINFMIAAGRIYVNLETYLLIEPDRTPVFLNEPTASSINIIERTYKSELKNNVRPVKLDVGETIAWNGAEWTIMSVSQSSISLLRKDGKLLDIHTDTFETYVSKGVIRGISTLEPMPKNEAVEMLRKASGRDLEEALRRYHIILPRIMKEKTTSMNGVSGRTERQYWTAYRQANNLYGHGFVGLIPNNRAKGNRTVRESPEKKKYIDEAISDFTASKQKGFMSVHRALNSKLEKAGLPFISIKTLKKKIRKALSKVAEKLGREGERAAYAVEDIDWSVSEIPVHGDWPMHIAHIDHTELDIELVSPETGENLGKLWLTLMIDAKTRIVLAVSVIFDPPSYRSIMNVLRECVRRHGRLPHTIVTDNGSEFKSTYYDTLLAYFKILKKLRPPSAPRFGAVIERLIGTINTTFLYNLSGNTQATKKNLRNVTRSVNPKNLAVWTPERIIERIEEFAYEILGTREHSSLFMSPREAFENGLILAGYRKHMLIPYDLDFIIMTFPSTKKGTAKVTRLGVKINNIWYQCENFKSSSVQDTEVEVRYNPYDFSAAYAYINGEWRRCTSKYEKIFKGRSEHEIKRYCQELHLRMRKQHKNFTISDSILAEFIASVDAEEKKLFEMKRIREAENKKLLRLSELESILPKECASKKEESCLSEEPKKEYKFEPYEEVTA
jgi:putative transposase